MAKKILLIEDDSDVREALKLRIEADGFEVAQAGDGEEGLTVYEREKPNLIILDTGMPKMDGFTFVKVFKSKYSLEETPILVLTGRSGMRELFELEGVRAFLTKPCNGEELVEKIKSILN
ncbi:MAG TPA: response regulator [Candidatus Omnitrophota bacterium]|nr:response regulator [Candidatus Omnitrophota bacterium]